MIETIAKNLVKLKREFAKTYSGTSHIQEVIPSSESELFPVDTDHLKLLHLFASTNPIYYNSYDKTIDKTVCTVYEGDINKFWLNSIQHGSSHAPFSPTWIFSAYVAALLAIEIGVTEVIDIGSGDGRIAYCAKILGLNSYSIEIDNLLVDLQKSISTSTRLDFNPNCADATKFNYDQLNLNHPAFFIGGLAQMGGDILANSIIEKINANSKLNDVSMIFAGTYSKKYPSDNLSMAGWGKIIQKYELDVIDTISLPTVWTFREPDETPYLYTKFSKQ